MNTITGELAVFWDCEISPHYSPRYQAAGIPLIRNLAVLYEQANPGATAFHTEHALWPTEGQAVHANIAADSASARDLLLPQSETPFYLEISMVPDLIEPIAYYLPLLPAGEKLLLPNPEVIWRDPEISYSEGEAQLVFRLSTANAAGYSTERSFELIDPQRYPGSDYAPELILTYCEPDHPYVEQILDQAGRTLSGTGDRSQLRGYDGDPLVQAEAIFQAIRRERLIYTLPKQDSDTQPRTRGYGMKQSKVFSQLLRPIESIARQHLANAIELAVLYAATLEKAGLNPIIVMLKDECLVGAYLTNLHQTTFIHDSFTELREASYEASPELFLVEASLLAGTGRQEDFREAIGNGARILLESGRLSYALDVRRGRELGVHAWAPTAQEGEGFKWKQASSHGQTLPAPSKEDPVVRHILADQVNWLQILVPSIPSLLQKAKRSDASAERVDQADGDDAQDSRSDYQGAFVLTSLTSWKRPLGDIHIYDTQGPRLSVALEEHQQNASGLISAATALEPDELVAWVRKLKRETQIRLSRGEPVDLWLSLGALAWFPASDDERYTSDGLLTPLLLVPAELVEIQEGYCVRYQLSESRLHPELAEILDELGIDSALLATLERNLPKPERELPAYRELTESLKQALRSLDVQARVMDTLVLHDLALQRTHTLGSDQLGYPDLADSVQETTQDEPASALPSVLFAPLDHKQLEAVERIDQGESLVLDGPASSGKMRVLLQALGNELQAAGSTLIISSREEETQRLRSRLDALGMRDLVLDLAGDRVTAWDILEQFEEMMDLPLSTPESDYQARLTQWHNTRRELDQLSKWYATEGAAGQSPAELEALRPANTEDAPVLGWPLTASRQAVAATNREEAAQSLADVDVWIAALTAVLQDIRAHLANSGEASLESYEQLPMDDVLAAHPWYVLKQRPSRETRDPATLISTIQHHYDQLQAIYALIYGPLKLQADPDGWYLDNLAELAQTLDGQGMVDTHWFAIEHPEETRRELQDYREMLTLREELQAGLPSVFLSLEDPLSLSQAWDEAELRPIFRRWSAQRKIKSQLRRYAKEQGGKPSDEVQAWLKAPAALLNKLAELQQTEAKLRELHDSLGSYLQGDDDSAVETALETLERWRALRTDLSALYPIQLSEAEIAEDQTAVNGLVLPSVLLDTETFNRVHQPRLEAFLEAYSTLREASIEWSLWAGRTFRDPSESLQTLVKRAQDQAELKPYIPAWLAWLEARATLASRNLNELDQEMCFVTWDQLEQLSAAAERACRDAQIQYSLTQSDLPWQSIDSLPSLQQLMADEQAAAEALSAAAPRAIRAQVSRHLPDALLKLTQARETDKLIALLRERGRGRTAQEVLDILAPMLGTLFPAVLIDVKTASKLWPREAQVFDLALVVGADTLPAHYYPAGLRARRYVFSGDSRSAVLTWGDRPSSRQAKRHIADREISMLSYAEDQGAQTIQLVHLYGTAEDRLAMFGNLGFYHGRLRSTPTAWHRKRNPLALRRHRSQAGMTYGNVQSMALMIRQELQMMAEQYPESQTAVVLSDKQELLELLSPSYAGLSVQTATIDEYPLMKPDLLILANYEGSRLALLQRRDGARYWQAWISRTRDQVVVIDHDSGSVQAPFVAWQGGSLTGVERFTRGLLEADSTLQAWHALVTYAGSGSRIRPTRWSDGGYSSVAEPALRPEADWLAAELAEVLSTRYTVQKQLGYSANRIDVALPADERLAILLPKNQHQENLQLLLATSVSLMTSGWRVYVLSPWQWNRQRDEVLNELLPYLEPSKP